jgi:hypothetical protein
MLFFVRDNSLMNDPPRELDHRTTDRIDVWLLWRQRDDRVVVTVFNRSTGEGFQVDVRDGERALDVFHHPYAYADRHGVDTRPESRGVTRRAA